MHTEDAVELARNIKSLHYGEWTDVVDGLVYITCGECGQSHAVMLRQVGERLWRIRIDSDQNLTDATRETDVLDIPLYRELIAKREEVKQLQLELDNIIEGKSDENTTAPWSAPPGKPIE